MTTIKEVARRAGVSVTTVSRVLNHRGYISSEMYQKVGQAMKELNYRPNELARSLLRQSSRLIGVLVPIIDNPFFGEVVSQLIRVATARGYKIILYCSGSDPSSSAQDYVNMLEANQVDGIILCLNTREIDEKLDRRLPVVSFERYRLETLPTVSCDNRQGGELAALELLRCGCRHPVMAGLWDDPWMPAYERYPAFCDVMRAAGRPYGLVEAGECGRQADYARLARLVFERYPQTDGVFCTSDHVATYILQQAARTGRRIPQDVKVVGFNDNSLASMLNPPLTSVRQPLEKMCEAAVDLLIRQIQGEEVPQETVLPVTLHRRESTRIFPE